MSKLTQKKIEKAVREHCANEFRKRQKDLLSMALWDLSFGPFSAVDYDDEDPDRGTQWPGYVEAISELNGVELPGQLWFDADAEQILESAPEGWEDEDGEWFEPGLDEGFYELDAAYIRRAVFGALVGNGL